MRMLFSIQTHFIDEYTGVLVDALAAEDDFVDVSIDLREMPPPADRLARSPRVRLIQSRPVIWCGPSQIFALLDSIRGALAVEGWDWFINVSGDTMPLRPLDELRALLDERFAAGKRALISDWGPIARPLLRLGEDRPPEVARIDGARGLIWTTPRLAELFAVHEITPIRWPEKRFALDCTEGYVPKALRVTPASPAHFAVREEFYRTSGLYCSRAFYVLHREICEAIAARYSAGDPVIDMFAASFQPDETFLATFLHHHIPDFAALRDVNDVHYGGGIRAFLTPENVETILASNSFLARKVHTPRWREVYRMYGRPLPG